MVNAPSLLQVRSLLTLRETRALLGAVRYRILVGLIAITYALSAMIFGGMLYFPPTPLATAPFFYIYPSGPGPPWMYPAILAGSPYFQLDLPFLSAILMTLSAAGVGLGMALAVLLGARLIRRRTAGLLGPTAVGSVAGFTPAMIALVTLGACCSTTAAATAGITLAAQSSGTSAATLLANTWYLGLFQVVVVYVALVAQEQLVRVYGLLFGGTPPEPSTTSERIGAISPYRLERGPERYPEDRPRGGGPHLVAFDVRRLDPYTAGERGCVDVVRLDRSTSGTGSARGPRRPVSRGHAGMVGESPKRRVGSCDAWHPRRFRTRPCDLDAGLRERGRGRCLGQ